MVRLLVVVLGLGLLGMALAPRSVDRPDPPRRSSVAQRPGAPRPAEPSAVDRARIREEYGKLPLSFIENRGQADERVAYYFRSAGHSAYFTPDGLTLRLIRGKGDGGRAHTIEVELLDAATERIESRGRAPGVVSYFKGPRADWKTAIPTHTSIGYVEPWPGIDLSYRSHGGRLESVYTVAPHADPGQIKLRYSGQTSLELDEDGSLVYTSSIGEVKESAPILYQDIDEQRIPVDGRFALLDENTVGFAVAAYDPDHALVIDPTLVYAGYIGGDGSDEGRSIAVDGAGNAYVVGATDSTAPSFPVTVGPDLVHNGVIDAFVAKVSADGTALLYLGYIGGNDVDEGRGVAVDSAGNAYVTGSTSSSQATFPVTVGPDLTINGVNDGFVAKVNAAGTALVYAGYIGGIGDDSGIGIVVDGTGNAYVAGQTYSTQATFPVTVGPDLTFNGNFDAFVAKVNAAGTALVYAGYIGGSVGDSASGIAVDGAGNAYVAGATGSTEATFPEIVGPDLTFNGSTDAFVAKVNADGAGLAYCGYIGGGGTDLAIAEGNVIAVDSAGNAYVTGWTDSSEASFPVLVGPDLTSNGGADAFVAKVNVAGSALDYAGYLGGSGTDEGHGIAVDGAGNAYVIGWTTSTEAAGFPVLVGPDLTHNGGGADAFVAKVNAAGSALSYAGYVGGAANDRGFGIAVDGAGNAYVTGFTESTEGTFPETVGPDLTHSGSGRDAFVAKIGDPVNSAPVAIDDTASTDEDTAVTIAIATLLANDTDADGDTLTLTEVTQGINGSVTIVGTDVVYAPVAAFVGTDAFTYTVQDPSSAAATATVTVTVRPVGADAGPSGADASPSGADAGPSGADAGPSGADAGGGADAGSVDDGDTGCGGCGVGGRPRASWTGWLLFALCLARLRRRAAARR